MMIAKLLKKKFLKCLRLRKFMDIGLLRPSTLPQVIMEVMKVVEMCIKIPATLPQVNVEVLDVGQVWTDTIPLVIVEDMLIEVDLGNKRPDNLPLKIGEQDLMLKRKVDIGLQPDNIRPVIKANVVDCWLLREILLVVMGDLDIGTRLANIPPKNEIVGVTVQDMKVGLKRWTTIPFSTLGKVLMVLGEVYLGLRVALLHTIIQAIMVDNLDFIVMVW